MKTGVYRNPFYGNQKDNYSFASNWFLTISDSCSSKQWMVESVPPAYLVRIPIPGTSTKYLFSELFIYP